MPRRGSLTSQAVYPETEFVEMDDLDPDYVPPDDWEEDHDYYGGWVPHDYDDDDAVD